VGVCPHCGSRRYTDDDGARVCEGCGAVFPNEEANMEDPVETLGSLIGDHLRFATASERIGCAISAMKLPLEFIGEMGQADPELRPELAAAVEHLSEATQALHRAHKFARARLDVRSARALGQTPTTEGDTT
jgi:hypothetical protein